MRLINKKNQAKPPLQKCARQRQRKVMLLILIIIQHAALGLPGRKHGWEMRSAGLYIFYIFISCFWGVVCAHRGRGLLLSFYLIPPLTLILISIEILQLKTLTWRRNAGGGTCRAGAQSMYFHAAQVGAAESACHSVGLKEYKKAGILLTRGAAL